MLVSLVTGAFMIGWWECSNPGISASASADSYNVENLHKLCMRGVSAQARMRLACERIVYCDASLLSSNPKKHLCTSVSIAAIRCEPHIRSRCEQVGSDCWVMRYVLLHMPHPTTVHKYQPHVSTHRHRQQAPKPLIAPPFLFHTAVT